MRPVVMKIAFALRCLASLALAYAVAAAQPPSPEQVKQERAQAELDTPKLVSALELTPGMTVADVGAGFGAMSVVLAKWLTGGHVFATDIAQNQLTVIRDYIKREGLTNVTVIESAAAATNLPAACCDAMFLQNVYHHLTAVREFNASLKASLKPGGRLAIIDAVASQGSELPKGVPANRGGHGVPPAVVVEELTAVGFVHVRTIDKWPPGDKNPVAFLALFRN